jgi:hypothetical protein
MTGEPEKKFHVIRQDSNGNHFFEGAHLSEEMADALLDKRQEEIGDHHQTIWKQDAALPLPQPFHH